MEADSFIGQANKVQALRRLVTGSSEVGDATLFLAVIAEGTWRCP